MTKNAFRSSAVFCQFKRKHMEYNALLLSVTCTTTPGLLGTSC